MLIYERVLESPDTQKETSDAQRMSGTAPLNPFTLRFHEEAEEAAFAKSYARGSVLQARLAILMGLVMYASFGLLDPWMVQEALHAVWLTRGVICALILLLLLVSLRPLFLRHMQLVLSLVSLVGGLGVTVLVVVAQDADRYYDYYVGLVLILFFVHVLLRMRFVWATAVSWTLIAVYNGAAFGLTATPLPVLFNSNFFLVGANVSGMFASYLLERYAREVFWQQRLLQEKQQRLEAEDRRKSKELEAARRIQLAMLPQQVPACASTDIAVYAQPATEVGGDYYDFECAPDGTLTFAIGDATGHGAQASAMVTATKVLFVGLTDEPDLAEALRKASHILKRAHLSRGYMALALGRLCGGVLELAGAGMPPALIHRAATGAIEEVPLKGLPLGSFPDFPYAQAHLSLTSGDTVLLMSDGLPELFNAAGELLGYERITEVFRETADAAPEEIIKRLVQTAERWRGERLQNDDVTLLLLKMKTKTERERFSADGSHVRSSRKRASRVE